MLLAALSWDAAMSATIDHAGLLLHAYATRQPLLVAPSPARPAYKRPTPYNKLFGAG